jgi:hypothetical protein
MHGQKRESSEYQYRASAVRLRVILTKTHPAKPKTLTPESIFRLHCNVTNVLYSFICSNGPRASRGAYSLETVMTQASFRQFRTFQAVATSVGRAILASVLVIRSSASLASAQITFAGVTKYAFNGGALAATATVNGLSVTQDGFNVTTSPLFANVSQAAVGGVGNNFGRVSLTVQPFFYINVPFRMEVAFTKPTTANVIFNATVLGSVNGNSVGGVTFTFSPATVYDQPYSNGPGSGFFSLTVNNVSINARQTNAQLTGSIVQAPPHKTGGQVTSQ